MLVYKLININLRYDVGGWSIIAAEILNKSTDSVLFCVDLLEMSPIEGNCIKILKGDFKSPDLQAQIKNFPEYRKANVILSDMLHNTTGHKSTDQIRSADIVLDVLTFCEEFLSPGGSLLCKYLVGSEDIHIMKAAKLQFIAVKSVKPAASRCESAEMYLLCKGYKGP